MTPAGSPPLARLALVPVVLSLLVPGLGHVAIGERRRGAGFLAVVTAAFGTGLLLDGRLAVPSAGHPLTLVATLTTASTGCLWLAARLFGLGAGNPGSATFEFGNGYLLTAGTMSLLLAVDLVARAARSGR